MELKLIFEAIRSLLSSSGTVEDSNVLDRAFEKSLNSNITSYKTLLQDSKFDELTRRLEIHRIKAENPSLSKDLKDPTLALYHNFTTEAIALVTVLDDHMHYLQEEDQHAATQGRHPSAPAALLSVSDLKTLHSLLEFTVSLGVFPYLSPGVDGILRRSLNHADVITKAVSLPQDTAMSLLYSSCSVISRCFDNEVIGPSLISRHFSDVLAALIQVCYAPKARMSNTSLEQQQHEEKKRITSPGDIQVVKSGIDDRSIKESCMELLQGLLKKTYQPVVVRELVILQGMSGKGATSTKPPSCSSSAGPKWLHRACGRLLSERLLSKNGVQHVISGIMDITAGV